MKKFVSILSACLVIVCMMVLVAAPVSAASPKEDIVAAAKAALPEKYHDLYLTTIENVLQQIDVTAEQAEAVIANLEAAKAAVKADKGDSMSEYTADEQKAVLKEFGEACETLGLTYEIVPAENPTHEGDVDCIVKVAGSDDKIASIDADVVKKTNVAESTVDYTLIVVAAGVAVLAVGAAVYGKKLVASR